ncbi:MAG: sugar metabolism transcriptional regulator [Methylococcaceae bacterium]|nr:sugar metabolism transcriptional regulator [Methylococcaceae bacterium]
MILSDLRSYLKQQRKVALADLAIHFNMDANALRGMLGKWMSKGHVRKLTRESACGTSCCQCDPAMTEIYEWIDN